MAKVVSPNARPLLWPIKTPAAPARRPDDGPRSCLGTDLQMCRLLHTESDRDEVPSCRTEATIEVAVPW